jgi:hypothetical protein
MFGPRLPFYTPRTRFGLRFFGWYLACLRAHARGYIAFRYVVVVRRQKNRYIRPHDSHGPGMWSPGPSAPKAPAPSRTVRPRSRAGCRESIPRPTSQDRMNALRCLKAAGALAEAELPDSSVSRQSPTSIATETNRLSRDDSRLLLAETDRFIAFWAPRTPAPAQRDLEHRLPSRTRLRVLVLL